MPGRNDRGHPRAICLTNFALHRAVTDVAETVLSVTESVDFSSSVSAIHNHLHLYLKRTAGAGTVDIKVYVYLGGAVAAWVQVYAANAAADGSLHKIPDLWAGRVKVVCSNVTAAATWSIFEAHSVD